MLIDNSSFGCVQEVDSAPWSKYCIRAACFDSVGIIIRPTLKNIKIRYIKLLKRVLGSETFTINTIKKTEVYCERSGIPKRILIVLCNGSLYFLEWA